jgi:sensor c-di-GMP phosphodiesterase-like protein
LRCSRRGRFNLKNLPFDLLEIDDDFVRTLANGAVDQLVVNRLFA